MDEISFAEANMVVCLFLRMSQLMIAMQLEVTGRGRPHPLTGSQLSRQSAYLVGNIVTCLTNPILGIKYVVDSGVEQSKALWLNQWYDQA